MRRPSLNGHRAGRVEEALESLPGRYLGSDERFEARYEIRLDDIERVWQVHVKGSECEVSEGKPRKADTVIHSDSATWLALRDGRRSGLDAFADQRLWAEGNLDLALAFEGMFALPGDRPPRVRVHEVETGSQRISSLSSGSGEETVLLLHGLGGTKSSFFRTVSALAPDYTVHALDFPGFGSSSKPANAPYSAEWLAGSVLEFMDALGVPGAHVVGNSMGGRVALELGLLAPERVRSLSLLAPALAWRRRRTFLPLVRLLRPELSVVPHPMLAQIVREQVKALFCHPDLIDPHVIEAGTEDFCRSYRSRAARIAFYAAARNIYLDPPFGDEGLWTRLGALTPPALFVWGDHDALVPAAFERHVAESLPDAEQVVLEECGHVPMIELPKHTHSLIKRHIGASSDLGSSFGRWRLRAAS